MGATAAQLADSVLLAVASIPAGRVTTYADVGRLVGCGPRLVARILAGSGGATTWWRVVRADGSIAEPVRAEATRRLAAEGVPVVSGRLELARYRVAEP